MTKKLKFLDVFSGIGGFRMGLERAGHECIGHIEFDKYANQSYKAIYGQKEGEYSGTDITKITDFTELRGKIDLLVGGFPCQAFSIAGDRKGFQDTRGTLFFDLCRILEQTKPPLCLFENVKGLLSHNKGQTFETIIKTLDDLGYDCEWQVLNSKDFGVPQNRERVFIIGHLRGRGGRKVFPITSECQSVDGLQGQHVGTITTRTGTNGTVGTYIVEGEQFSQGINQIGNLIDTDSFGGNPQVGRVYGIDGISPCLNTMCGGGREPKIAVQTVFEQRTDEGIRTFSDGLCDTIRAGDSGGDKRVAIPVLTPDRAEKRQNGRRFKENGEPMFTLATQDRHGVMVKEATKQGYAIAEPGDSINLEQPNSKTRRGRVGKGIANTLTTLCNQAVVEPFRIRKLTPKECWRLQGFPDWAFDRAKEAGVSDSQLYKQAGNSVTVNVVEAIGRKL